MLHLKSRCLLHTTVVSLTNKKNENGFAVHFLLKLIKSLKSISHE